MKAINIAVEPFQLLHITECMIHKTVNEHFTAVVSGYITSEEEERIMTTSLNGNFGIKAQDEDEMWFSVFKGYVRDIILKSEGDLKLLTISAVSNTCKLEREAHIRTFQGRKQTYRKIVEVIAAKHENTAIIYSIGNQEQTDGLTVQYEENDWEFLKRMASELSSVLIPDCTNDHTCFYFGFPDKKKYAELNITDYQIKKYHSDGKEKLEYLVKSREDANLCTPVTFQGRTMFIYDSRAALEGNELTYEYCLRPRDGFEVRPLANEYAVGASIIGSVEDVEEERVRVSIHSENDYTFGSGLWFQFATVYSSPDGTGWYCMPEIGDQIRIYFPDADTRRAYVISAVHVEDTRDLRKDPDEKSIRTIHDKEIRLTPDKILITNHHGTSILLDDNSGIRIRSNRKIAIISGESVEIRGNEKVTLEGNEGVYLQENQNVLMVRNGIKEQAMNIEHR